MAVQNGDSPRTLRREDFRFLTGRGQYLDDIVLPGMLHAAMLRSPHAHALIRHVDVSRALALPGVHGIITGADVQEAIEPERGVTYPRGGSWHYIGTDRVRFAGEVVAVVAADDRYLAEDALDLIDVEYEPLPAVLDPEHACDADQPELHPGAPGGNEVLQRVWDLGDVDGAFAEADVVVSERLEVHRHSATPLEGLAAIASHDPASGQTTIWANMGNLTRYPIAARALRVDPSDLRLIVPDVGGHFGAKAWVHQPAVLLAVLSQKVGRPVKWIEDRAEHLAASVHGGGRIAYGELAARRDGTFLGLRLRTIDDQGAYTCLYEPYGPFQSIRHAVGCYTLKNVLLDARCVLTNRCPVAAMRGYGRVQHFFVLERLVDRLARALEMDPAELRRRNFIDRAAYPYETPARTVYDSGDPAGLLDRALAALDYQPLRRWQAEERAAGRLVGLGFCASVEGAGPNVPLLAASLGVQGQGGLSTEVATIRIGPDGRLAVQTPTLCQGQSHETTIAQIVADQFGVDPGSVSVNVQFDSSTMPYTLTSGTYGSRFSSTGAVAVHGAATKLRDQLGKMAATLLEADPADVEFQGGRAVVRGAPQRSIALAQIAATAHAAPDVFGSQGDVGLQATSRSGWPTADFPDAAGLYNAANTYAVLVHAAVVEVDTDTGAVKVLRYVATEDCGRIVNPAVVRGLAMGGVAHGLGWALTECLTYDESGQLLTGSFMDYLPTRFTDMPPITVDHLECPTPFSPLGAKGMGEGGAIPVPACIANAVEDAVWHLGGRVRDSHLAPEVVLKALRPAHSPYPD